MIVSVTPQTQLIRSLLHYWKRHPSALATLGLLVLLSVISSSLLIFETFPKGDVISALGARDGGRLVPALTIAVAVNLVMIPVQALKIYVQGRLVLDWRQWMTRWTIDRYFSTSTFYPLLQSGHIDNPDQRITEDLRTVTQQSLGLGVLLLDSVVQFVGFVGVLWWISPLLVVGLIAYAGLTSGVAIGIVGRILAKLNVQQSQREADFRFSLVRVRDNAEGIAFYQGETVARQNIQQFFQLVLGNFKKLINQQFWLSIFQNLYFYLGFFLPFLLLAPRILSGEVEIGAVQQSQAAFERVSYVLGLLIYQLNQLSGLTASWNRLSELTIAMDVNPVLETRQIQVADSPDDRIVLQNLTVIIPDRVHFTPDRILIQDLNLNLTAGESLLIQGASGVGKTSLLRAVAGLWSVGSGTIERPKRESCFFVPQRPYLTIGSLREQLLYPNTAWAVTDVQILQVLAQVELSDRLEAWGGLEACQDWAKILSGGEQQRLAFARVFIQKPTCVFLDEATSAIDEAQEAYLYEQLRSVGVTYISIGHRSTLVALHDQVLDLGNLKFPDAWMLRDGELR